MEGNPLTTKLSDLTGTIVITGANSTTGRRLLPLLQGAPARKIALVRRPEANLPADEVITDWTNSPEATAALRSADVVIHLSGVFAAPTWDGYQEGTVRTAEVVAEALAGRSTRVVYFSYVDADPESAIWYVKSKGLAEQALAPLENAVIFRIQPIVRGGDAPAPFEQMLLQRAPGAPVRVYGDGTQRTRPIHVDDVAAAAIAAAAGHGKAGTYDLGGPLEGSVTELVHLVNGHSVPVQPVSVEAAAQQPGPPPAVVDVLAHLTPARDVDGTAKEFGLQLTSPSTIWPLQPAG
jgi:nucleoside-diphosphate-sugar epimerase